MGQYLDIAVEAALEAGKYIKRSVGNIKEISFKGDDNIVTNVDKHAELIIMRKIRKAFPGHGIISEETPPKISESPYKWIIDPLDGTTNFTHGFPFFSVSIALAKDEDLIAGVVYDPMRDELFRSEAGRGAFLNRRRIGVSKTKRLKDSLLVTGFAYGKEGKIKNLAPFKAFLSKARGIRRTGSAAIDLAYVASGRFDGFWEYDLKPWDSAAGSLIVREAGGIVTTFKGKVHTPFDCEILSTNGYIHGEMLAAM